MRISLRLSLIFLWISTPALSLDQRCVAEVIALAGPHDTEIPVEVVVDINHGGHPIDPGAFLERLARLGLTVDHSQTEMYGALAVSLKGKASRDALRRIAEEPELRSLKSWAVPPKVKSVKPGDAEKAEPKIFEKFRITPDEAAAQAVGLKRDVLDSTLFILPSNDGEAHRAVQMLRAAQAPHVQVSKQEWGATLEKEPVPDPLPAGVKWIAVFEIPSLEVEQKLREKGIEVVIIDHHFYQGNDRRKAEASLEQLASLIGWKLSRTDLAIAVNDKAYIPGLKAMGLKDAEISEIRKYDLVAQGRTEEDVEARVKEAREIVPRLPRGRNGVFIIDGDVVKDTGILKQEIALMQPDGVAHSVELSPDKMGFSGSPEIVDKLKAVDFEALGYEKGAFKKYGGGSPPAMFYGFKPTKPPRGEWRLIPPRVRDYLMHIVESEPLSGG